jgi:hypothetical protein
MFRDIHNNTKTINPLSKYQRNKRKVVAAHIRKANRMLGGVAPLISNLDAGWR